MCTPFSWTFGEEAFLCVIFMRSFYEFKKKRVRAYLAGKVCGGSRGS